MKAKSMMYAAVGAPVVAARKLGDKVSSIKKVMDKQTAAYTKRAETRFEAWAGEGEKVVSRITDRKMVEELSAKVDLDQAKEQVSKLRDQLEDMLDTWRTSFRPEKADSATPASAMKPAAKKPAAKKPAAKKPAAKKPAAKKPAAKKPAAKTTRSAQAAKPSTRKTQTASAAKAS